ncbi:RES family NAD+ phosphorylase [Azospirillum sp. ST 5-10]|uniref:RES family NAD+ phosphorylase n=1 Tax=unclassified Azospirillum TaxID=2630922 RepID=UPI003F49E97C
MTAFRIADDRFPLLDGGGAFRTGGRWNSKGRYVIYAGIGFATAMLEKLVRTRIGVVPAGQQFAEIFIPGNLTVEEVGPSDVAGWSDPGYAASRAFGDAWYDSRRSAVLIVPSHPAMGFERNVLIHQLHADFADIRAARPRPVLWDARLFAPLP